MRTKRACAKKASKVEDPLRVKKTWMSGRKYTDMQMAKVTNWLEALSQRLDRLERMMAGRATEAVSGRLDTLTELRARFALAGDARQRFAVMCDLQKLANQLPDHLQNKLQIVILLGKVENKDFIEKALEVLDCAIEAMREWCRGNG